MRLLKLVATDGMNQTTQHPIAIIGAGIGGSACARALTEAGYAVVVFDKSRGVGGRMSTRRAEWTAPDGSTYPARFDHGAQYFTARQPEFAALCQRGLLEGWIAHWPTALDGEASADHTARYVAQPDMPQLARVLLDGIDTRAETQITALSRNEQGWQLRAGEDLHSDTFSAVVLANPPAQAAALLAAHDAVEADRLAATAMLPCWTLMAVTDDKPDAPHAMRINSGPLSWVARNDSKPGRPRQPGFTQWVAQASPDWSAAHRDSSRDTVEAALKSALAEVLGCSDLGFHLSTVHRWLYARPAQTGSGAHWDARLRIGLCGDHAEIGRVESAYNSGLQLARLIAREA